MKQDTSIGYGWHLEGFFKINGVFWSEAQFLRSQPEVPTEDELFKIFWSLNPETLNTIFSNFTFGIFDSIDFIWEPHYYNEDNDIIYYLRLVSKSKKISGTIYKIEALYHKVRR